MMFLPLITQLKCEVSLSLSKDGASVAMDRRVTFRYMNQKEPMAMETRQNPFCKNSST
jgi:hypothetical protein